MFLNYYRNNTLPVFIIPSLIANVVSYCRSIDLENLTKIVSESYSLLKNDFFLKWERDEIAPVIQKYIDAMQKLNLLNIAGSQISSPEKGTVEFSQLEVFGHIVGNVMERYCLYISVLGTSPEKDLVEISEFGKKCENLAKKLSILGGYHESDYFDKNEYKQFIEALIDLGYLKKTGDQFQILSGSKDCIQNLLPLSEAITKKLKGTGKNS